MDSVASLDCGVRLTAHPASILKLPAEIMLEILSLLDVSDLLEVRQTCMVICRLSQDRSVWLRMLLNRRSQVPIPPPYDGDPIKSTHTMSPEALERLVLSIYYTEHSWLLPRAPPILLGLPDQPTNVHISEQGGNAALLMDVLADRWLLVVYVEGLVRIWDLYVQGTTPASTYRRAGLLPQIDCCFSLQLSIDSPLSSACASMNEEGTAILITPVSQSTFTVLGVQLPSSAGIHVTRQLDIIADMTHVWRLPSPTLMVRAIHPASRLAFFSYSDTLVLLQWDCGKVWQLRTIDQVVDEEIWTGITDAKFVSPRHILCVKTHDVELLTLPSTFAPQPGLPKCSVFDTDMPCEHIPIRASPHFFGLTFRGVSMSEAQITPGGRHAETRVRISFLAYDILRGLFHYRVSVLLPPTAATDGIMHDEPPPHMSVRLLAVHRLAQLYATTGEAATNVPRSRSGFTPGSRGFVSACFMGRTGKRGVWIERRRGSMQRNVIAFSTALDALGEEDAADDGLENTPGGRTGGQSDSETDQQDWTLHSEARPIDGRVIYEVNSYDLRDDITRCAFAEAMGTVILGNRKGDLKLL